MVKIHRGWYLVDVNIDGNDRRKKNEKEAELVTKPVFKIKRCDGKITLHPILHEQREPILVEKQSRTQAAVEAKRKETEVTHRLAAELSRHKNEEVKHALKDRLKSSTQSPSNCNLNEARSRVVEEKEASQADLLESCHQDKSVKKVQRAEDEERKRNLVKQNHSMDNPRRLQQKRIEGKEPNCKIERAMRKTQEENAKMKKKKENKVILLREEIAASLAAKDVWEKKYKEALKNENKTIARIVAEKETRQEKQLGMKAEFRAAKEMAIDNVARMLLANVCKERIKGINDKLYLEEQKSKWMKKSDSHPMSKKQYIIVESFQEMIKQQKAEHRAKDKVINNAFAYLAKKQKKMSEKKMMHNTQKVSFINQLTTTSMKLKDSNKIARKKIIDMNIRDCVERCNFNMLDINRIL
ncbi:hypothetical protein P5V15_005463 [Pogonomyrmex californicus]